MSPPACRTLVYMREGPNLTLVDMVEFASAVGQVASAVIAIPVGFIAWFTYQASRNAATSADKLTEIEARREWADRYLSSQMRHFGVKSSVVSRLVG